MSGKGMTVAFFAGSNGEFMENSVFEWKSEVNMENRFSKMEGIIA
jgi:hypothetical protein